MTTIPVQKSAPAPWVSGWIISRVCVSGTRDWPGPAHSSNLAVRTGRRAAAAAAARVRSLGAGVLSILP